MKMLRRTCRPVAAEQIPTQFAAIAQKPPQLFPSRHRCASSGLFRFTMNGAAIELDAVEDIRGVSTVSAGNCSGLRECSIANC
jgi:hypothetical protein